MAHAEPLVQTLMDEVVAAAAACGVVLNPDIVEKMLENTRKMVPYDSSMALDYRFGRPMEIEAIYGLWSKRHGEPKPGFPASKCYGDSFSISKPRVDALRTGPVHFEAFLRAVPKVGRRENKNDLST